MKKGLLILFVLGVVSLFANSAFVLNSNSQTLSKIDLESNEIVNDFAILGQYSSSAPNKLEIEGNIGLVTITYENSVQKINLETGETISFIGLDDSSMPNDLCIYDGNAYVTGNGNSSLYKINIETEEILDVVEVGLAPQGIIEAGGYIWVANTGFNINNYQYEQGTVSVINPEDMSIVATINTSLNPVDMMQLEDKVYVVCTGNYVDISGELSVINISDLVVESTISIGGSIGSITEWNNKLYLGNSWPAGVYVYDLATSNIESTPNDNIFIGGSSINCNNGILAVVDVIDYVENSIIRLYDASSQELFSELEAAVGATDIKFMEGTNSIEENDLMVNLHLTNYPNPVKFGSSRMATTISFNLPEDADVSLEIYNIKGEKIRSLYSGNQNSGKHQYLWNGKDSNNRPVSAGVYLYKLEAGKFSSINKMVVVK